MSKETTMVGARYVLAVQDLAKSATYYQEQLGFETWWSADGWHFLKREKFMVMLGECQDDVSAFETGNHSYFAYVEVEGIDNLYAEYQSGDIEILAEITDRPWGQREFAIRTIDGHRLMFGEEIPVS